jgi:hypothetical protein
METFMKLISGITLDKIILFLLGLGTIRSIISAWGIVPEDDKFFSRLIYGYGYGKRHIIMNKEEIIKLGEQLKTENDDHEKNEHFYIDSDTKCYQVLLRLIKHCMFKFNEPTRIGDESPILTEFYIDTMAGVHEEDIQYTMRDLMIYLVKKYYNDIPNFVITPKNGNTSFGKIMALSYKVPILLHKHARDPSRVVTDLITINDKTKAKNHFKVNFEGSLSNDIKHDGILIDCNASSGKQIIHAVREFKELIKQQNGINGCYPTLNHVFTLFRANDDKRFDEEIKQNEINFHCILKLSEEIKHKIYNNDNDLSEGDIKEIINELRKQGYLMLQT